MSKDVEHGASRELRFRFGANWQQFVQRVGAREINEMRNSIRAVLPEVDGQCLRILDVGCGSGLASAAFVSMGSTVESFDVDGESVDCSRSLREKLDIPASRWSIWQGSILSDRLVSDLERFDVVYAWGVLHHTGNLWRACENAARLVRDDGYLMVAIYNDQKGISTYWTKVKYIYNKYSFSRPFLVALHAPYLIFARKILRWLVGKPQIERGMSYWHDMLDWLGGYPFEVAAPQRVVSFFESRSFVIVRQALCGTRHGCNEFVFRKLSKPLPS